MHLQVNPALLGGPKWPALRQAFRVVKRSNGNVIMASDGLSDPFDDMSLGESWLRAPWPANNWADAKHTVVSAGASS